jgi:hypothetical protein
MYSSPAALAAAAAAISSSSTISLHFLQHNIQHIHVNKSTPTLCCPHLLLVKPSPCPSCSTAQQFMYRICM